MKEKQGISLIVLVITIIVMVILAGAIVLTLNNSGIIDKASDAVVETNLATVKELTQMAWADAYAKGERTEEGLKAVVDKALSDNKVDTSKFIVEVTTSGVTVELKGESKVKWIQQGLTVTNGKVTLELGDSIAYDETAAGTITGLTDTDWKVLGASDEGELLIMSTNDVDYLLLGDESYADLEKSQNDWLNGVDTLNGICEEYGKGTGSTGARSVTAEDINKVTDYNPETAKYKEGEVREYGNEVTFLYNGTTNPSYTSTNGQSGTVSNTHSNGFHYYNGTDFVVADLSTATGTITTLKNDAYINYGSSIENGSKLDNMIFGGTKYTYWLASNYTEMIERYVSFGMRCVLVGNVMGSNIWTSRGGIGCTKYGVRAVVSLSSDINLVGSSESGWNINN